MKLPIERNDLTVCAGWQKSMSKPLLVLPALQCMRTKKTVQVTQRETHNLKPVFCHPAKCLQLPTTAEKNPTSSANVKLMQRYSHPF